MANVKLGTKAVGSITTVTALINWWYNNSFTQAAIEGDKTYENVKNQIH